MNNIFPMEYEKQLFPFSNACWANATVAAKHFGKLTKDWLKLGSTKNYIREVGQELDIEAYNSKGEISPLLVNVEKGRNGGTWIHPELVIEFARWLSPKFARACDRHIKNMLISQNRTLTEDQIINLLTYQEPTTWVYQVVLPDVVYAEAKEAAKGSGEKIHQYLKPEASKLVEEQLKAVTMLANSCADYKDFEARCMSAFGVRGQLKLIYPAA